MTAFRDAADWLPWHRHPRGGDTLCDAADKAAQSRPTISVRPLIGTLAVMLGSVIATLDSRISVFGLADVRGAVHAGFDEGAWITTAFTVGQMMIGPVAAWLGAVFGVRRVLMISQVCLTVQPLLPFSPNLASVLHSVTISTSRLGPHSDHWVCGAELPPLVVYASAPIP